MGQALMLVAGVSAVGLAALMAFQRSLYAAAVCFLAVLLQTAVLFYGSGARLLAALLVLLYAGAVAVLIVVSIQSSDRAFPEGRRTEVFARLSVPRPLVWLGLLLVLAETALLLARGGALGAGAGGPAGDLLLGPALFGPYAPAVEAVGFLILVASLALVGLDDGEGAAP